MIWDEAMQIAEQEGYSDWSERVERAKVICKETACDEARARHLDYLNSPEWKLKREIVLKRDNYFCQDCSSLLPHVLKHFEKLEYDLTGYHRPATEVHHLNYAFLNTNLEVPFCISLCSICHKIRHFISPYNSHLLLQRELEIIKGVLIYLSNLPESIEERLIRHKKKIESLTIRPSDFFKEVEEGKF